MTFTAKGGNIKSSREAKEENKMTKTASFSELMAIMEEVQSEVKRATKLIDTSKLTAEQLQMAQNVATLQATLEIIRKK